MTPEAGVSLGPEVIALVEETPGAVPACGPVPPGVAVGAAAAEAVGVGSAGLASAVEPGPGIMPFADETLGGKLCEPPAAPLMVPPVGAGVAAGAPDRAVLSNSAIWAEHGPASDGTTLKARRPPALASSAYALIGFLQVFL